MMRIVYFLNTRRVLIERATTELMRVSSTEANAFHSRSSVEYHDQYARVHQASSPFQSRQRPQYSPKFVLLSDMNELRIKVLPDLYVIEDLVKQIEQVATTLTVNDVEKIILPLMQAACRVDKKGTRQSALICERLLHCCLSRFNDAPLNVYNTAIIRWGSTKSKWGAKSAQFLFDKMKEKSEKNSNYAPPNRRIYKSLIRAWAISGALQGPETAAALLLEMEKLSGLNQFLLPDGNTESFDTIGLETPDRSIYNTVLSAYAKSAKTFDQNSLEHVYAIIARMDKLYELTGNEEFLLDEYSYSSIFSSFSRFIRSTQGNLDHACVARMEKVFRRFIGSQTPVVNLFSRALTAEVIIEGLLKTKPLQTSTLKAVQYIRTLVGRPIQNGDILFKVFNASRRKYPDLYYPTQTSIMKVIVAVEKLKIPCWQDILIELSDIAINARFPRIHNVNEAAIAWSNSGWSHAPELIEALMERTIDRGMKLTGRTYFIAMLAWLRASNERMIAPHRCELLMEKLVETYQKTGDGRFLPREVNLRCVLNIWMNRCEDGKRYHGLAGLLYPAEHIEAHIQRSIRAISSEKRLESHWIKNYSGHYSMAIRAWAKQTFSEDGDGPNVIQRAGNLLLKLERISNPAPAFPCNWCLDICSKSQQTIEKKKEAYDAAIDTFSRGGKNARTFVLIIKVIKEQVTFMDELHLAIIKDLFKECCSRGLLSQEMIWHVVEVLDASSLMKLFGINYCIASLLVETRKTGLDLEKMQWKVNPPKALLVGNLPQKWSQNFGSGRKLSRKSPPDTENTLLMPDMEELEYEEP